MRNLFVLGCWPPVRPLKTPAFQRPAYAAVASGLRACSRSNPSAKKRRGNYRRLLPGLGSFNSIFVLRKTSDISSRRLFSGQTQHRDITVLWKLSFRGSGPLVAQRPGSSIHLKRDPFGEIFGRVRSAVHGSKSTGSQSLDLPTRSKE